MSEYHPEDEESRPIPVNFNSVPWAPFFAIWPRRDFYTERWLIGRIMKRRRCLLTHYDGVAIKSQYTSIPQAAAERLIKS